MTAPYYTLYIASLPEVLFAHRYSCSKDSWHLSVNADIVEISACLAGTMKRTCGSSTDIFTPGELFVTPRDRPYTMEVSDGHSHVTAALALQQDGMPALLPRTIAASACPDALRALMTLSTSRLPSLSASAAALTLLAALDGSARAQKVENPHYKKALSYIENNLREATLFAAAEFAGVSPGYLASLFRKHGTTFTDYTNSLRISRAGELMCAKNITAQRAGEQVGICDPKYLSRLFKKYNGVSIRAFRAERSR